MSMKKQDKDKLDKLHIKLLEYLNDIDEADKIALERAFEIIVKTCNYMHIGLDAFTLMYLNYIKRIPLLIEYNAQVVDVKMELVYNTGNKKYEATREASKLSDYVVTDSEIGFLVNLGYLIPEVLVDKIKSYDNDTAVWELSKYFTPKCKEIMERLSRDTGIDYDTIIDMYNELHEAYPASFTTNNRVYNGKPINKDKNAELARIYYESIKDTLSLHEDIVKYVEANKTSFSNGLEKFIKNKQWEGKLKKKSNTRARLIT